VLRSVRLYVPAATVGIRLALDLNQRASIGIVRNRKIMADRIEPVPPGQDAVRYYSQKALEYRQKAQDTSDKMLKPALEAVARKYERLASEAKTAISENNDTTR